nr:immunoglobulin heavy chain junction region [Macaca mulatta]MOW23295.1 immunoglobulin heavy chain junction region [Macaca mulatta]MOW23319.1 immunoglobulin heavy chain junction region [Macaca mulatta]MOW23330.1 immunoglobulin heavy chain junction region [Macaca mulatta]MOW23394.1 immunoglobulin heavy chain junction region [Macaca mulatta]
CARWHHGSFDIW